MEHNKLDALYLNGICELLIHQRTALQIKFELQFISKTAKKTIDLIELLVNIQPTAHRMYNRNLRNIQENLNWKITSAAFGKHGKYAEN